MLSITVRRAARQDAVNGAGGTNGGEAERDAVRLASPRGGGVDRRDQPGLSTIALLRAR